MNFGSRQDSGRKVAPAARMIMIMVLLSGLVVLLLSIVGTAAAQTPSVACAADSLYLLSPDQLDLRLENTGKRGLTISWPNLDLNEATCFSLDRIDNLDFQVSVDGGFGDRVDRVFRFVTPDAGVVGGRNPGSITVTWQNQGPADNGNIGGVFNLSNNGGVWDYNQAGAAWSQQNNGLPMIWQRTNVVAMDRGTGSFIVAGFSRGINVDSESTGLYSYNGTNWNRLAPDVFNASRRITAVTVSATDNNRFAVGTENNGLYVTTDGGATFTWWRGELDPASPTLPTYRVTALNWRSNRLLVFMANYGLFISSNGGTSFVRSTIMVPGNLDAPNPTPERPTINDFAIDPSNPDRIVAGLLFHGAYETTDAGATWHHLNGNLVVKDPAEPGKWVNTGQKVLIDAANPQVIVMGVNQKGLYRTADGGLTWTLVADELQPANRAQLTRFSLIRREGMPGQILAMENGWRLLHSTDSGATWAEFAQQPLLTTSVVIVPHRDTSGNFTLGSSGGGIYVTGTTINLRDTYSTLTSASLRGLDLGLRITFGSGNVQANDEFELVAQTFQGWAVWRGMTHDPDEMTLIGLYDKVNPEDCYRGYCGDNSLEIVPQCFRAKRAACFNLSNPDTLRFFDEEIYNGFSYFYAVTSFDYGNTALTTAQNNTNQMQFSPRWTGDTMSAFPFTGNRTRIDINEPAAAPERDFEIYAYPNPVRLGAGIPGSEGQRVVFTNLPVGASVRVFTTAGDDVVSLGNEGQTGGQIYWDTINHDGEDIAPGVYLYKVEMPAREAYWGRIVVIR